MSQITEQQNKQLTFAEICPEWDKKLHGLKHATILEITSSRYCIVGEAYGFRAGHTDDYGCMECKWFSLCRLVGVHGNELQSNIANFVDHWNEYHV